MKRFGRILVWVIGGSLLTGSMIAEANAYGGNEKGSMVRLLRGLDLTAEQKKQAKEIMMSHRNNLIACRVAVLQARQILLTAVTSSKFDEKTVQTAYNALAEAQRNMTVLRAKILNEVVPILTPDQQAALKNKVSKMNQRTQRSIAKLQSRLDTPRENNP
jgi:Spy/CpxP family protein refolding chaperone